MSDGDREIMARPEYAIRMQRLMQEACRTGIDGWLDDDLVFVDRGGSTSSALTTPTMVWYGTDDTSVPPTHGRWLADNVPGAIVVTMDGGHLELVNRVEELMLWLIKGEVPSDAIRCHAMTVRPNLLTLFPAKSRRRPTEPWLSAAFGSRRSPRPTERQSGR